MHIHRRDPRKTTIRAYQSPVAGLEDQEPRAHGGLETTFRCRCGAERRENANGRHVERGAWEGGAQ